MPQNNMDMGIDTAGPRQRCNTPGPCDDEQGGPEGTRECEGCEKAFPAYELYDIENYGRWCENCLDKRLKGPYTPPLTPEDFTKQW